MFFKLFVLSVLVVVAKGSSYKPKSVRHKIVVRKAENQASNTTRTIPADDNSSMKKVQVGAYEVEEEEVLVEKKNDLQRFVVINLPPVSPLKAHQKVPQTKPLWVGKDDDKENSPPVYVVEDPTPVKTKKPKNQKPKVEKKEEKNEYDLEESDDSEEEFATQVLCVEPMWFLDITNITDCDAKPFASGSFGQVYRAVWKGNREAAIKVLKVDLTDSDHKHRLFTIRREIDIMKSLHSKCIVECLFTKCQFTKKYMEVVIVMEDGGIALNKIYDAKDMSKIKNKKKQRYARVQFFAVQISNALAVCHRNNILHRDLALKNVLVNLNGDVKLCDFGLSTFLGEDGKASGSVGTYAFMSPKMFTNKRYGIEADYYALGACVFEVDQLKYPADECNGLTDYQNRHYDGKRLCDDMDKKADSRVVDAVKLLCDETVANPVTVNSLELLQNKAVPVPKSVLKDIEKTLKSNKQ